MRILPSTGILSSIRFLSLERSVPLADCSWQGFIGTQSCDPFFSSRNKKSWHVMLKIILFGSTAISFGLNGNVVLSDDASASSLTMNNNLVDNYVTGLRRIEDGSIISNSHTIKWRIFTDNGKDLFQKGKIDEAEKYFQSALQEAKIGFGPRDSHVASACNNLYGGEGRYTGDGSVDFNGNPVMKHKTGNWKACPFILGTECCERLAYYGISTNLVTYLTTKLHQSNVSAARNVTTWQGTCYLAPLIGAVLADAYWGRYWTIAVFSAIYFIGMGTLTLSASVPQLKPPVCVESVCPEATAAQYTVFFLGLYLIALGTGGIKPCVSSFGADQFDDTDVLERVKMGSFFNWFYFSINIGALISSSFLVWVQDNCGWGLGFGIPTLFMGLAIGSFFAGTYLYRFQRPGGSPLTRMCQVLFASFRKWNVEVPLDSSLLYELPDKNSAIKGSRKLEHSDECRFLDKAATVSDLDAKAERFSDPWAICTVTQVEELKILVRMFPIWATSIMFSAVYAQMSTMFVEQGMVLDTTIGSFTIPPASLSTFDVISVIVWVPVYDSILVPIARRFTGKERGFSDLQRMGIGLFISILAMATAALVEIKRLGIANSQGLVHVKAAVPMTILWQVPQYFLIGASEIFTFIGQLEFFYDQSPDAMRSLCSAFSLMSTALGNYLSSFILTVVTSVTTRGGKPGWIPDNLNEGHLDNFFWLLAGLCFLNLLVYVFCANRYKCKRAN